MVQTRAEARGAPLKKEGAYDTSAYYDEIDQGYGDVGVDQEPDAGNVTLANDPDFTVSKGEMKAADAAAAEQPGTGDMPLKEDLADLQAGPAEQPKTAGRDGAPMGVVETSREEVEAQEAFTAAGVEEGVSTIPDQKA